MKNKINLQFAFFHPRVAIALVLCFTGVFIALDGISSGAGGADSARTDLGGRPSAGAPDVIQLIGKVSQNQDFALSALRRAKARVRGETLNAVSSRDRKYRSSGRIPDFWPDVRSVAAQRCLAVGAYHAGSAADV